MRFCIRWLLLILLAVAVAMGTACADGGILIGGYRDVMDGRVTPQDFQPSKPRLHDPSGYPAPAEDQASDAVQAAPAPEANPSPSAIEWICSNCGSRNNSNFCPNCGQARNWFCPECGAENVPTFRFCPNCGAQNPSGKVG